MPLKMFEEKGFKPSIANIVGIAAGKGGVGKSTVTANMALALNKLGYTVGVLDADIYGPSLRRMLPEDRLPGKRGDFFTPALSYGIRLMSIAYFRQEGEAAVIRAPIANGVITQFVNQVDWGDLDYLLVDFPPGTGDIHITLCQQFRFTGVVMVTTPQEVAAMDVRKAINMFRQVNVPILGIVENMSYYSMENSEERVYPFGQGGGIRLAQQTGYPLLSQLPIDPRISECCDVGDSLFLKYPESTSAKLFLELAGPLSDHLKELKKSPESIGEGFELKWKVDPHEAIKHS